ncbi:fluoride efflux transporter FluC [Glycocaulis sp.]|uniref:fluoride efflux transporter FluC n=1 Tax=Glycocaulis sp. TaxID=1969725 RepID=UPI003D1B47B8
MTVRASILLAVAAGGALGALARYALALALTGDGLPWGTLAANGSGSLLIGLYAGAMVCGRIQPGPVQRHFVVTGFCGGFTTFSIFSLEIVLLAGTGEAGLALLYLALSIVLWFAGVATGWKLAGARLSPARP